MFQRLFDLIGRKKPLAPVDRDFLKPKGEAAKKPAVVNGDRKAPLPVSIQDASPAILLPGAVQAEGERPSVELPPDIDPGRVAIVRHGPRNDEGERFKYVDKPLKPLRDEQQGSAVMKYSDSKDGGPGAAQAATRQDGRERDGEVFKYTPSRVVIKN